MKNLKLGFIAICSFVLAFSSFKKKDNEESPKPDNSFVIGNNNYSANNATVSKNMSGTALIISNITPRSITTGMNNINVVEFSFKSSKVPIGTLTYKLSNDESFDPAKNFGYVSCGHDLTFRQGEFTGGSMYEDFLSGSTIEISKNGDVYTITYNLKFTKAGQTINITGQFKGTLMAQ